VSALLIGVVITAAPAALDGLPERVADLRAIRLHPLAAVRFVPRAHEDRRARAR
jgi:hypothetical protein